MNQDRIEHTPEEDDAFNLIDTAANQQAEYSGVKTQSARIAQLEVALARLALQVSVSTTQRRITEVDEVMWVVDILEDK